MVVFIFGKAFYDSNVCISEAGAAWATNQNCLNVIVDIGFNDIEKPSNNSLSSIKLTNLHDPDQRITLKEFFETIISTGLQLSVDRDKLETCIQHQIDSEKYNDRIMNNPPVFYPKRKFLPKPKCPSCNNKMEIHLEGDTLIYKCANVSCKNTSNLIIE